MNNQDWKIECEKCGETVATASNVQMLIERILQLAARNNVGIEEALCEGSTDKLSFDDLRAAFASGDYRVYEPKEREEIVTEWEAQNCGCERI